MFLTDITLFMDQFVNLMLSGVTFAFNTLDSFSFHGVTLLDFTLAMILIPTGVAIFIAITKTGKMIGRAERRRGEESDS